METSTAIMNSSVGSMEISRADEPSTEESTVIETPSELTEPKSIPAEINSTEAEHLPLEASPQLISTPDENKSTQEDQVNSENLDADLIMEDLAVKTEELTKSKRKSRRQSAAQIQEQENRKQREKEQEARYQGVEIDKKLYVGSRLAAQNIDWLTETLGEKIYVLNISEGSNHFEKDPRFKYKRIKIADACEVDISLHFEDATNFISEGLSNDCCVFVHCREGKSRSIAMVIAYLMIKKEWTLETAYQHITKLLPWKENINQGFKCHLMNLDLKSQGKNEISLDFYDRRNRRRSKPEVNYCEIDEQDKKKTKKKSKSPEESAPLPELTVESYWNKITHDNPQSECMPDLNLIPPTSTTTDALSSTDPLLSDPTPVSSTPSKTKPRLAMTMDLDAIENKIEERERKRKQKRRLSKISQPPSDPQPNTTDPQEPPKPQEMELETTIEEKNKKSGREKKKRESRKKKTSPDDNSKNDKQNQKPDEELGVVENMSSPKKRKRTGSVKRTEETSDKPIGESSSPIKKKKARRETKEKVGKDEQQDNKEEEVKPLRVIIPQNLKQQTLFAYFKKL